MKVLLFENPGIWKRMYFSGRLTVCCWPALLFFRILFFQFQQTSQKCKAELIIEVQRLGGIPTQNAKIEDSFYRVWMNVIAILTGKNRNSILNSCKYSDDIAVNSYRETLKKRRYITHEQKTMLKFQRILK